MLLLCFKYPDDKVNTETIEMVSRGMDHVEGGWPKDVNYKDPDQVARSRKKVEKDESYQESVKFLMEVCG